MATTALPTGTVTFLFTDIEGSTRLWSEAPAAMREGLRRHDEIVRGSIEGAGGYIFSTGGDGFGAAFARVDQAVAAACRAQRDLAGCVWPEGVTLKVRMALHTGEAEERSGDYFGPALNRAARLMAAAHGGQVLCSAVTAGLVADHLPDGHGLIALGPHRLRDLTSPEEVHQVSGPGLGEQFPPLRSLDAYPGNLPIQATAFVGRDTEVKELAETVLEVRVVTLTGVGGVGKTRLALEVAAEVLPSFRDGAWLVELAGVEERHGVREAVSSTLGISAGPSGGGGLEEHLRWRDMLLILDNCEHLLEPVAQLVDAVCRSAPGVRVLATSREGLGVAGEHVRSVSSLAMADPTDDPAFIAASDAARLFVERAREASAGYRFSDEDAAAVAELCRRLDGIPLAIELAAARVPVLTPAEISSHLDRRFKLLTGGRRVAAARHQTLRNAIEWSYQLLDPCEQSVLDRLAVFGGSFDLRAAQAIATGESTDAIEVLDAVARLVGKSLVVAEPRAELTRYRLLETVRDFAWERLEERSGTDEACRRHAEYFAAFAQDAGAGLKGPAEAEWRRRVELDTDNLRSAMAWAVKAGEIRLALEPIGHLSVFGDSLAPYGFAAESAARLAPEHHLAPVALAAACWAAALQGASAAATLAQEAIAAAAALPRSPEGLWVRCRVANATIMTVILGQAGSDWQEFCRGWLNDARELGDAWSLCEILTVMAASDRSGGAAAGAEAMALARQLQAPSRIAFVGTYVAADLMESDPEAARKFLEEAAAATEVAGNDWIEFVTPMALAHAQAVVGDLGLAAETTLHAMERWAGQSLSGLVVQLSGYMACLLGELGDQEAAQIVVSWTLSRGAVIPWDHPNYESFGAPQLLKDRDRLSPEETERVTREASGLHDRALVQFVRERLDRLDLADL